APAARRHDPDESARAAGLADDAGGGRVALRSHAVVRHAGAGRHARRRRAQAQPRGRTRRALARRGAEDGDRWLRARRQHARAVRRAYQIRGREVARPDPQHRNPQRQLTAGAHAQAAAGSFAGFLGARVAALAWERLSPEAVRWAKVGVLDAVGVTLAGSREAAPP